MQSITLVRRVVQIGFFVLAGKWLAIGWLRCPYGVPFVSCPSCPLTECPGKYLFFPFLGLIGLASVVFGRAFCGWACPMGLVKDALGRLPKPGRWFQTAWVKADPVLKWLKWPALVLVVWAVFAYNYQPLTRSFEYVVRSPDVFNVQSYLVAWGLGGGGYGSRLGILLVALVGALVVSRFWCRYLCPLGALLGVFNKFSAFTLRRRREACVDCGLHPQNCIQHTCPETTDCVMCGDCAQACPSRAIGLRFRWRTSAERRPAAETPVASSPPEASARP